MSTTIPKVPASIKKLLSNENNVENLKEWIEIFKTPFKDFPHANISLYSVLEPDENTEQMLNEDDVLRFFFPTLVKGLHDVENHGNNDAEGIIVLSLKNKAHISFLSDESSVKDFRDLYTDNFEGSWEEVVKIYLDYVQQLTNIPKKIK